MGNCVCDIKSNGEEKMEDINEYLANWEKLYIQEDEIRVNDSKLEKGKIIEY